MLVVTHYDALVPYMGTESDIRDAFFAIVIMIIVMTKHCLRRPGLVSRQIVVMDNCIVVYHMPIFLLGRFPGTSLGTLGFGV